MTAKPEMPDEIWVNNPEFMMLNALRLNNPVATGTTRYIRADLATRTEAPALTEQIEGLRKPVGGMQPACTRSAERTNGWNAALDAVLELSKGGAE
jgi:hypothetical protein